MSAVIPTRNRPTEVQAAVASALAQTIGDVEVVVVPDGPDVATRRALAAVGDPRLRVLESSDRRGANAARNAGAAAARAAWVAFLDDDDLWLPRKLELQLELAQRMPPPQIVACRMELRHDGGTYVVPRRERGANEPISEYLFCRRGWRKREAAFQTSMILAPTELLRAVPFREDIAQNQETDWLFRALAAGARLEYRPETLGVWNDMSSRPRLTDEAEWRADVDWIRSVRALVTPRAYAAYTLIWAADSARRGGARHFLRTLLREAFRAGRPRLKDVLIAVWIAYAPSSARRLLHRSDLRRRQVASPR